MSFPATSEVWGTSTVTTVVNYGRLEAIAVRLYSFPIPLLHQLLVEGRVARA